MELIWRPSVWCRVVLCNHSRACSCGGQGWPDPALSPLRARRALDDRQRPLQPPWQRAASGGHGHASYRDDWSRMTGRTSCWRATSTLLRTSLAGQRRGADCSPQLFLRCVRGMPASGRRKCYSRAGADPQCALRGRIGQVGQGVQQLGDTRETLRRLPAPQVLTL